ncbi:MAG TPA: antibiotic biosynthesis monooxygenase family protein [Chitinophaga sp.]
MRTIRYFMLCCTMLCTHHLLAQTPNKNMKAANNFSVEIIRYTIAPDQQDNFEKAYSQAAKLLQASPYCLGYEVIHGEEEPSHYIVTIYWTSKEDHLNGFRKSSDFGGFFQLVRPFFANIDEMKHYNHTAITWKKEK